MKAFTVNRMIEWVFRILVASIIAGFVYALAGCSTQYIPVETVRTDSVFLSRLQRDSIFIRDSVYLKQKGDTVFQWKYKYVYKYVTVRDTAFIDRTDTIRIPVPVERKLTWWQQKKQDFGEVLTGLVVGWVLYRIIRWIIKRTRKTS